MSGDLAARLSGLSPAKRELLVQSLLGDRRPSSRERIRPRSADAGALPLSPAQERLWILDRLQPGIAAYHLSTSWRVTGTLDLPMLQRALDELARRHEALRTVFPTLEGQPVQVVLPPGRVPLETIDLRPFLRSRREREAARRADQEIRRPFHLAQGPLFRAAHLQLAEADHLLLLAMHHIVADGWSLGILLRELGELYDAFRQGRPAQLPELPIQYADFALWQRQHLTGETLERLLGYWKGALAGAPPLLALPTDRPRPPVQSLRGATLPFSLPPALAAALRDFAAGEGATLFMVLLAVFSVLLARRSGQDDLVVGTPIANRTRPEIEPLIGFFVNTLPLRIDLAGDPSFRALAARVREVTLGAYVHQDLPFERLVQELQPERSLSHNPIFQVSFTLQTASQPAADAADTAPRPTAPPAPAPGGGTGTAKFDLSVALQEAGEGLDGALEYNSDLFTEETARHLAAQLSALAEAAMEAPDLPFSRLRPVSAEERAAILRWGEGGRLVPPERGGRSLHEWVEAHAAERPEAPALEFGAARLTYAEMNARANRIAWLLRDRGVGPDHRVGLFLERSLEMVVSLLAVLKAGAAYVPMDPAYPAERLELLFTDSRTVVVLTQERLLPRLPPQQAATALCVDTGDAVLEGADTRSDNPEVPLHPDNLSYVIYTSGSTGRPKGAMLSHRGLAAFMAAQRQIVRCGPDDRVLQFASLSFDGSVYDIALAFGAGAALVVGTREEMLPGPAFVRWLREKRITAFMLPPSALALVPEDPGPTLRIVLVAGEACPAELAERWSAGRRFLNCYGPTEMTVWSTVCEVGGAAWPPLVGRPLPQGRAFVLDRHFDVAPVGVPGEIFLGGEAIARGYLERPELTAERFLPDPFSGEPGARLYRSGDLGRYRADGNLEFLRRIDDQVKIRGFRIEPREIEAVLLENPAVASAAVVVREDRSNDRCLVAYAVPANGDSPTPDALRRYLSERLPSYMVPAGVVVLEALPLTPNGKLDHRALPPPWPTAPRAGEEEEGEGEPTSAEAVVARIWREVLGVAPAGRSADFFELGGHSLSVTRVVSRLTEALSAEVPMRLLFENPTFGAFCAAVEHLAPEPGQGEGMEAIPRLPREVFRVQRSTLQTEP